MQNVDLLLIRRFLVSQPGVLDAWVGYEGRRLVAEVTIVEGSNTSGRTLQLACREHLGQEHMPSAILLVQKRSKAA